MSQDRDDAVQVNLPIITKHPQSQNAVYGDRIVLSLSAKGSDKISYQWDKDGVMINKGGNSSVLYIDAFSSEHKGSYMCTVNNKFGSVQSEPAEIKGILGVCYDACYV